jgi:hypothetical protein
MSRNKNKIAEMALLVKTPFLPGSVSTAVSKCGKPNCVCKATPPRLHGVYYRWTGMIDGKRTTKTITKEQAEECKRRIENYGELRRKINRLLEKALAKAPWNEV